MLKQKIKNIALYKVARVPLFVLTFVLVFGTVALPHVSADRFQEQIQQLQAENNQKQGQVSALKVEANSLQATIDSLQAQINALQADINANQAQINTLKDQIAAAEEELAKQRKILGQNIKQMYLEGEISTLEMLASSNDLSDFVDKQQYRIAVQEKIKTQVDKINALKHELRAKKEEVERRLKELQASRDQIAAQRSEQNKLLGLNQSEQAAFNNEIKQNFAVITELKRQQAIENARLFGGGPGQLGGGGYPWGYAVCLHTGQVDGPCSNYDWSVNGSIWNWATGGYGFRNCTDWASWRVRSTGRHVPGGLGNAKTWDDRAPAYGYSVGGTPVAGSVAVSNSGFYGHVMYVEAVNGDGSIVVSDYNRSGTGKYTVTTLSAATASNLNYVYF